MQLYSDKWEKEKEKQNSLKIERINSFRGSFQIICRDRMPDHHFSGNLVIRGGKRSDVLTKFVL